MPRRLRDASEGGAEIAPTGRGHGPMRSETIVRCVAVVVLLSSLSPFALSARLSPDTRLLSLARSQGARQRFPILSPTWGHGSRGRAVRLAAFFLFSPSPR